MVLVTHGDDLFAAASTTGIEFDEDFLLASFAQLSGEATAAENWCLGEFFSDVTASAQSYKATTGFSNKTKCTW